MFEIVFKQHKFFVLLSQTVAVNGLALNIQ